MQGNGTSTNGVPHGQETHGRPNKGIRGAVVLTPSALLSRAAPVSWLVEDLLVEGGVFILGGLPKLAKKTFLMLWLAWCVATGQSFLGLPTTRRRVIYLALEDGVARFARRLVALGITATEEIDSRLSFAFGARSLEAVREMVLSAGEPVLLVIDPLVVLEVAKGIRDENAAVQIEGLLQPFQDLAQDTGSTIIITHHFKKDGSGLRGSGALEAAVDGWLDVRPQGDQNNVSATLRDAEEFTIGFELVSNGERLTIERRDVVAGSRGGSSAVTPDQLRRVLLRDPSVLWSQERIAKELRVDRGAVRTAVALLKAGGELEWPRGPKSGFRASTAMQTPQVIPLFDESTSGSAQEGETV